MYIGFGLVNYVLIIALTGTCVVLRTDQRKLGTISKRYTKKFALLEFRWLTINSFNTTKIIVVVK